MEFRTFWFGKYKGKEICGIIASHTGYILWLLENTQFKLTEFEQGFYDVVALARAYGEGNYVYPKKNLIKFIKNKNQDTPFYSGSEFFGTKKEYDNNIFVKVYSERYCHNAEYDLFAYKPPRKDKIWDTMVAIHKSAFEYLDTEKSLKSLKLNLTLIKLKYLCGKYWKCSKIEKDCTINLYFKANRVYFDDEYYGTTVVDCTPIEICKDTDGKLKWYTYMEHCNYQIDEDFQVSNSFNPSELEEITEGEFLNNKKV